MNKYELAALLALAGLDTNEWTRIPAATQRDLFGCVPFGRCEVKVDGNNQGMIWTRRWVRLDIVEAGWSYEDAAHRLNSGYAMKP